MGGLPTHWQPRTTIHGRSSSRTLRKLENDPCGPPFYSQNKRTKPVPNLNPFSRRVSCTHMVTLAHTHILTRIPHMCTRSVYTHTHVNSVYIYANIHTNTYKLCVPTRKYVHKYFVLHSFMCLKTCHFAVCFTILWTSISVFYINTARDVVTVLLIFAKFYHFTYTISHTHTEAHTHTSTHVQSSHKRNGDNQAQEPGWERREKEFVRDLTHTHTIYIYIYVYILIFFKETKTDIHESKRKDSIT